MIKFKISQFVKNEIEKFKIFKTLSFLTYLFQVWNWMEILIQSLKIKIMLTINSFSEDSVNIKVGVNQNLKIMKIKLDPP